MDVLHIDEGEITLGGEFFEDRNSPGTYLERIMIRYSIDATANLNYNPGLKMIIHDHLIQRIGRMPGQGPVMLPDGTYEGYEWKDGKWQYVEKIYEHTYDEAPRPTPVLDEKKNIFGKN